MSNYQTTDLNRRLSNIIRLGKIAEVDYETAQVRVEIGELLTAWLPWLSHRAGGDIQWWAPEINEQVVVISPNGDLSQGIVLNALYQDQYPGNNNRASIHQTRYADGAIIEYDREAHHLKAQLPSGGTVEVIADGGVSIIGDVTITGALNVSENITAEQDVNVSGSVSADGDVTASGISLVNHQHIGDSGSPTQSPIG